jgi:hypothetical protein
MNTQNDTTAVFVPDISKRTGLKNLDTSALSDNNE